MEATFENEKFGKEKLELFVFVVVFVVFETEKYERCEFQYEAGKNTLLTNRQTDRQNKLLTKPFHRQVISLQQFA
jgi:hypothetical protein